MIRNNGLTETITIVGDNGNFKTTVDKKTFLDSFYKKVHNKIGEMERLADLEGVGVPIADITGIAIRSTFEEWLHITIDERLSVGLYKCIRSTKTDILDEQIWELIKIMLNCKGKWCDKC